MPTENRQRPHERERKRDGTWRDQRKANVENQPSKSSIPPRDSDGRENWNGMEAVVELG